jgi:hypothetical protein
MRKYLQFFNRKLIFRKKLARKIVILKSNFIGGQGKFEKFHDYDIKSKYLAYIPICYMLIFLNHEDLLINISW